MGGMEAVISKIAVPALIALGLLFKAVETVKPAKGTTVTPTYSISEK